MDAPKCQNFPSCGKRHYGDCAGKASPPAKKIEATPVAAVKLSENDTLIIIDEASEVTREQWERLEPLTQVERNRRWREKNKDRYNAGQKELMRERRSGS